MGGFDKICQKVFKIWFLKFKFKNINLLAKIYISSRLFGYKINL